jgi:hypothetical protein
MYSESLQMHVLRILAARRTRQLDEQRLALPLDQARERRHDFRIVRERMQPAAARANLARRLRPAQQ